MINHKYNLLIIFCFIFIFSLILLLNLHTPIFADDWVYSGVFGEKKYIQIQNILQIIDSQYNHYLKWGGRTVVHSIDQYLLSLNNVSRSIIKSLVFIIYLYLIYKIVMKNVVMLIMPKVYVFCIIVSSVFLLIQNFDETILWTTGASNYLFGMTIVLLFIYPVYSYCIDEIDKYKGQKIYLMVFFISGIVAGWTNENLVAAVILGYAIFFYYLLFIRKIRIPIWLIVGFIGLIIGFLFMILAPGNYIRMTRELTNQQMLQSTVLELLIFKIKNVFAYYLFFRKIQVLIFLFSFFFFITLFNRNRIQKKKFKAAIFFFIIGNLCSIVMLAAPLYPPRATFSMVTFLIIANSILISEVLSLGKYYNTGVKILVIVCSVLFFIRYGQMYDRAMYIETVQRQRLEFIDYNIKNSNLDIVLDPAKGPQNSFYYDFYTDSTFWLNKAFCKYYGLKTIRVKDLRKDE